MERADCLFQQGDNRLCEPPAKILDVLFRFEDLGFPFEDFVSSSLNLPFPENQSKPILIKQAFFPTSPHLLDFPSNFDRRRYVIITQSNPEGVKKNRDSNSDFISPFNL